LTTSAGLTTTAEIDPDAQPEMNDHLQIQFFSKTYSFIKFIINCDPQSVSEQQLLLGDKHFVRDFR
jgi:hypothetical protein